MHHCTLGRTSFSIWNREYWLKGPIGCRKKNVYANYKQQEKTASHNTQTCDAWKQFLSADWLFMAHFHVTFQTTTENPLSFLITFLSSLCLFSHIWIPTCCVLFSELFFRWDNQWHFRSANNNFTFQLNLSLLHAFLANFKNWFAYCEQNDREPNGKLCQNFGLVQPCWLIHAQVWLLWLLMTWLFSKLGNFCRFSVISVKNNVSTEI